MKSITKQSSIVQIILNRVLFPLFVPLFKNCIVPIWLIHMKDTYVSIMEIQWND